MTTYLEIEAQAREYGRIAYLNNVLSPLLDKDFMQYLDRFIIPKSYLTSIFRAWYEFSYNERKGYHG